MAKPGEGSAKEEVNIAHEVDFDVFGEFRTKDGFLGGVCGIEDKIVHVDANM